MLSNAKKERKKEKYTNTVQKVYKLRLSTV